MPRRDRVMLKILKANAYEMAVKYFLYYVMTSECSDEALQEAIVILADKVRSEQKGNEEQEDG